MLRLSLLACGIFAGFIACAASTPAPTADDPGPGSGSSTASTDLVIPPIGSADASAPIATGTVKDVGDTALTDTRSALGLNERDPRIARRRPRSRALVLTEIQGLERLFDTTKSSDPSRPQLRRRIAEDYNELSQTASGPDARSARVKSIEHYEAIVNESPTMPTLDEVLYYMALAHELNGNLTKARSSYYDLIKRAPQSKLIPLAYFAFGEMFYVEALNDPTKNDLANQAFAETIKYPAANNSVYADALLRMGQIAIRKGETTRARQMFDRLKREQPDSNAASQIPPP